MKTNDKKMTLSKWHLIFANFMVLAVYVSNFVLVWFDKMPMSDIAIAIITAYGGFATGGYYAQNILLKQSLNKHGITHGLENIPGPHNPVQLAGGGTTFEKESKG